MVAITGWASFPARIVACAARIMSASKEASVADWRPAFLAVVQNSAALSMAGVVMGM